MKVVITGCNGSVGQRVSLLALKHGHIIVGADHTPLPLELCHLVKEYQDRFTFHQIDLKDYDHTLELLQKSECQAVIHLAGIRTPSDYKVQTHHRQVSPGSTYYQKIETATLLNVTHTAMSSYHGTSYELVQK